MNVMLFLKTKANLLKGKKTLRNKWVYQIKEEHGGVDPQFCPFSTCI